MAEVCVEMRRTARDSEAAHGTRAAKLEEVRKHMISLDAHTLHLALPPGTPTQVLAAARDVGDVLPAYIQALADTVAFGAGWVAAAYPLLDSLDEAAARGDAESFREVLRAIVSHTRDLEERNDEAQRLATQIAAHSAALSPYLAANADRQRHAARCRTTVVAATGAMAIAGLLLAIVGAPAAVMGGVVRLVAAGVLAGLGAKSAAAQLSRKYVAAGRAQRVASGARRAHASLAALDTNLKATLRYSAAVDHGALAAAAARTASCRASLLRAGAAGMRSNVDLTRAAVDGFGTDALQAALSM